MDSQTSGLICSLVMTESFLSEISFITALYWLFKNIYAESSNLTYKYLEELLL